MADAIVGRVASQALAMASTTNRPYPRLQPSDCTRVLAAGSISGGYSTSASIDATLDSAYSRHTLPSDGVPAKRRANHACTSGPVVDSIR